MLSCNRAENSLLLFNLRGGTNLEYHGDRLFTQDYLKSLSIHSYHLYLLSNDEMNKGEWCYNSLNDEIIQAKGLVENDLPNYYKIIATTNKDLSIRLLDEMFVESYVAQYNQNNIIEEVFVEWMMADRGSSTTNEWGYVITNTNRINPSIIKTTFTRADIIHALTYGHTAGREGRRHAEVLQEYKDINNI